jgi:hypothetical protein
MSDVHFLFAKNSELIFTVDGRHLCSSVNPTKEAQQWTTNHQDHWKDCGAVIVLGLGCGYHVRALRTATHLEVVAVETDPAVISAALRVHPLDLKESEIVSFAEESDLTQSDALIRATRKSYAVVLHDASIFTKRSQMLAVRRFLLGRQKDGLEWLFKNRNLPFTGHTQNFSAASPDLPIWNALRELIV